MPSSLFSKKVKTSQKLLPRLKKCGILCLINKMQRTKKQKMATIRQVAALAGVSIAAVSRILNNDKTYKATEDTRKKVMEAVRALDYTPSPAYTKRKKTVKNKIGVFTRLTVERTKDSYYSAILNGISDYIRSKGYDLEFVQSQYDMLEPQTLQALLSKNICGLILMNSLDEKTMETVKSRVKHIVGIDTDIHEIDNIRYNRFEAGTYAMQYLIENGHKKIAFIGSFGGNEGKIIYPGRFDAYQKSMRQFNLPEKEEWIIDCKWTRQICFDKTKELMQSSDRPTAIFIASDHMAMASISAIHESELRVPEDVSVVGISDIEMSKYLNPPLTTVAIPQTEIGEIAASTLLARIEGDNTVPKQIFVPTKLVVRDSVAKLE